MQYEKIISNRNEVFNGPLLISPTIFKDVRGFFYESWNENIFNKTVEKKVDFCQDNHSKSSKGVLRGLHYQIEPESQSKLVRTTLGSIFDVIVDLRKDSITFGQWAGVELDQLNKKQLWIPDGFAHGFLTLSEFAEVQYKTSKFWSKEHEKCLLWNDNKLKIKWPTEKLIGSKPIISNKDKNALTFEAIMELGFIF